MNVDQFSRYKTIEASVNKRYGNRWSGSIGGAYLAAVIIAKNPAQYGFEITPLSPMRTETVSVPQALPCPQQWSCRR